MARRALRIDGSIATGQEHKCSDLDLLVDLTADQTLLGLIRLQQELEDHLGCPVDVTEAAVPIRNLASIDSQRDPRPGTTARNKDRLYLESIRACLERIEEYAGANAATFIHSRLIQDGAIRNLEVIGEARKKLCSEHRDANPAIPWPLSGGDVVRP
jgi:predicted nucleotidyltransferase